MTVIFIFTYNGTICCRVIGDCEDCEDCDCIIRCPLVQDILNIYLYLSFHLNITVLLSQRDHVVAPFIWNESSLQFNFLKWNLCHSLGEHLTQGFDLSFLAQHNRYSNANLSIGLTLSIYLDFLNYMDDPNNLMMLLVGQF